MVLLMGCWAIRQNHELNLRRAYTRLNLNDNTEMVLGFVGRGRGGGQNLHRGRNVDFLTKRRLNPWQRWWVMSWKNDECKVWNLFEVLLKIGIEVPILNKNWKFGGFIRKFKPLGFSCKNLHFSIAKISKLLGGVVSIGDCMLCWTH